MQRLRVRGVLNWYILLPKVNDIGSGDGTVVVRDIVQRHHGTYAGMPTAPTSTSGPGRTDRSTGYGQWNLDGTNDYINLGTSPISFLKPFTITAWIRLADITSNSYVIVGLSFTDTVHSYALFMHRADKGGLTLQYTDSGSSAIFPPNASQNATANIWTHAAVVVNAPTSTVDIYQNGVNVSHTTSFTINPLNVTGQSYSIGVWGTNNPVSNFFKGAIDDVKLYDKALSAEEVRNELNESQRQYPIYLQRLGLQWARPGTSALPIGVFFPWFQ